MLAEFAARMNCGGADVGTTASFMRQMMQSATRPSYDNVIATQTFGDDTDEEVMGGFQHVHKPKICIAAAARRSNSGCLCLPWMSRMTIVQSQSI